MRKFKRGEILALSGDEGLVLCQCCQNMNLDSTNVKVKWLKPVLNGPENVFKESFMGTLKDLSQIIDGVKMINKGGLFHLDKTECKRLKDLQPDQSQVREKKMEKGDVTREGQKRNNATTRNDTKKVLIPKPTKKFNMKNRLKNLTIINSINSDIISEVIKKSEDKGEVNNNKDCYLPNCQVDVIDEFMFFSFNSLTDLDEFEESSMFKSLTMTSAFVPSVPQPQPHEHSSKSTVQPIFLTPPPPTSTSTSLISSEFPSTTLSNSSPPVSTVSSILFPHVAGVISAISPPVPTVSSTLLPHVAGVISDIPPPVPTVSSTLLPHVPGVISDIPPPVPTVSPTPQPLVTDVIPTKLVPVLTRTPTPPPPPLDMILTSSAPALDVILTPPPPVPDVSPTPPPPVPDVTPTPPPSVPDVTPTPPPPVPDVFPTPPPSVPDVTPTPPPPVPDVIPMPQPPVPDVTPTPPPCVPDVTPTPPPPVPDVIHTPLPTALTMFPTQPFPDVFPTALPPVTDVFPTPVPTVFPTSTPPPALDVILPSPPPMAVILIPPPLLQTVIPTPPPIGLCPLPILRLEAMSPTSPVRLFPPTAHSMSLTSLSSVHLVPSTPPVLSVPSTPLSPVGFLSPTPSPPAHSSSSAGPTVSSSSGIDEKISKMFLEVMDYNALTSSPKRSSKDDESEQETSGDDEEVGIFRSVHFVENVKKSYKWLREKNMFSDVTISCEKSEVEAHKLILASSSYFFSRLLERNSFRNNPHPIIILKDIKMKHLRFILDFMYTGVLKVPQNDIAAVHQAGEALEVKGLKYHNPSVSQTKKRKVDQFSTSSGSSFPTKRSHSISCSSLPSSSRGSSPISF